LGFKRPHLMNEAFLMKMLWNLTTKPKDLWCRVLYSKYGRNNDLSNSIRAQNYDSPLWKALALSWGEFQRNIVWIIGDGLRTNFWLDKWGSNNFSLITIATQSFINTTFNVKDVTNSYGDWDNNFLFENLPDNIANKVIALPAPAEADGPDTIGWGGTSTCQFSIKRAYNLLTQNQSSVEGD
jgi:hypothetical protein